PAASCARPRWLAHPPPQREPRAERRSAERHPLHVPVAAPPPATRTRACLRPRISLPLIGTDAPAVAGSLGAAFQLGHHDARDLSSTCASAPPCPGPRGRNGPPASRNRPHAAPQHDSAITTTPRHQRATSHPPTRAPSAPRTQAVTDARTPPPG